MVTTRIPDGFVFVPRAPGVAAELLNAADRIKANRQLDVRTTRDGYHVREAVAQEYQKKFPGAIEEKGEPVEAVEDDLPVTSASPVAEIDEYAASLEPPVDVSGAKNRAEKIRILKAARNPESAD